MGNCFGIPFLFEELRSSTLKVSELLRNGDGKYDVIQIGDAEEENRVAEESEIGDFCHEFESSGSAVLTNTNQKVDDVAKMIEDIGIEYDEKSLQFRKKEMIYKRDAVPECFEPLTEADQVLVGDGLSHFNKGKVLVSHCDSNIVITGETLQCLRAGAWLNDEVVNLYFELLKEREKREPKKFLKCHFFNTFFLKKLTSGKDGYDYQSVRRWTTKRKLGYSLFDCEKIFVPVHKENHWSLGIINKKDREFQHIDSFRMVDTEVMNILSRYYIDEAKDKTGKDINVSSWKQQFVRNLPMQKNGYDCGMFMIKYADFYSRDVEPCFNQNDMPYFRQRTTKEIFNLWAE